MMNDENINYLRKNFVTFDEVAERSGIDPQDLSKAIKKGELPRASYTVTETLRINSPLEDEYITEITTDCFPLSYVDEAKEFAINRKSDTDFLNDLRLALKNETGGQVAYGGARDDDLDKALRNEIKAYKAGIYGICTLDSSTVSIIKKEVAVKKLIDFEKRSDAELSDQEKEELTGLVSDYDRVASLFAPYQRETSSRGKYVDAQLRKANREDLIKHY